jgi:hypothetical protein
MTDRPPVDRPTLDDWFNALARAVLRVQRAAAQDRARALNERAWVYLHLRDLTPLGSTSWLELDELYHADHVGAEQLLAAARARAAA